MRRPWVMVVTATAVLIIGASTIAAAKAPGGTGRQIVERTVTLTPPPGGDFINLNEVVTCPQGTASVNGGYAWATPQQGYDTLRHAAGGPEEANWRVVAGPFYVAYDSNNDFTLWTICVNA
jgi:hypothetical protein